MHRYAILLASFTLLLVVAGASVTSKGAGLSVPDWPLSYGQVMPQMTGGVLFEHGHRLIGATVGMLTIGLLVWILRVEKRAPHPRAWMRKMGWLMLAWVCVVGALGGLTVKLLTPPPVSITHTCLAQLFFSLTVAMTIFTSKRFEAGPEIVEDRYWPPLRGLAIGLPMLVLAQIALGAGFRHGVMSVIPHIVGAMVVALAITIVCVFVLQQFPHHQALTTTAKALLTILMVQLTLGVIAFVMRLQAAELPLEMVISTVAHVAVGAITLATSIVLSIQIRYHVRPAVKTAEQAQAVAS
ncbi:MAG TPA: COX15/CtaA family protein [Bryobacteraceae bacterium]|nr:COX15/CtaA family protein [Bryobacteraceae bacterium]